MPCLLPAQPNRARDPARPRRPSATPVGPLPRAQSAFSLRPKSLPPARPSAPPPTRPAAAHIAPPPWAACMPGPARAPPLPRPPGQVGPATRPRSQPIFSRACSHPRARSPARERGRSQPPPGALFLFPKPHEVIFSPTTSFLRPHLSFFSLYLSDIGPTSLYLPRARVPVTAREIAAARYAAYVATGGEAQPAAPAPPPAWPACAGARERGGQPARRPACVVARPCTQARQCLQASPPLHTCPSVAVRVPPARPCARVRRGPHVCPRRGLRVVGVPATRSRVPGATSRASCVIPVCRRCHRRPCPQQPRRNLRSVAAASPSLRVVRAARPCTSPRARPPSSRGEHRLHVSNIVSPCLMF
jgi:hypothetical protein